MDLKNETIDFAQISGFIRSAEQKLKKAERIIGIDEQIGFQAAYEAMLRAALGFMLSHGVRPRSTVGHHRIIIEFVSQKLGTHHAALMSMFDYMRRKRNEAIYEPISATSEKEAQEALAAGREFIKVVTKEIRRMHPQQTLLG